MASEEDKGTPPPKADAGKGEEGNKTPSTNSDGLVKELREEAKNNRLKYKSTKAELDLYKLETEDKLKKSETEKQQYQDQLEKFKGYNERIVKTELKAEAIIAGIKDTDLIQLIDTSKIKVDENGNVDAEALKAAVTALKEAKPFLFGDDKRSSTSSNSKATQAQDSGNQKDVMNMTAEEYRAQKRDFLNNPRRNYGSSDE